MWYNGRFFKGTLEVVIGGAVFYLAFMLLPRKPHHITTVSFFYIFIFLGLWAILGGIVNLSAEAYERMKKN